MATPGHLIKDSPKKISQNAKQGSISGFYPKEILAQVFSRDFAQGDQAANNMPSSFYSRKSTNQVANGYSHRKFSNNDLNI
jgi:hypothetical protein